MMDPRVVDPAQQVVSREGLTETEIDETVALLEALRRWREIEHAVSEASRQYMKLGDNDMKALRFVITAQEHGSIVTPSAIADHLGGHCRTIRRTAVGPFRVEDADEERVLAPFAALVSIPERGLNQQEALSIRQGRPIPGSVQGPVALHFAGHLVAVAQGDGHSLKPETVLPPA